MDNDGVLVDDINPAVDKRFPRTASLLRRGYVEGVFVLMHIAPKRSAARMIGNEGMQKEAVDFMKEFQDGGSRVMVCTANQRVDAERIEALLSERQVDARVFKVRNTDKARIFDTDKAILVEDDPWVALRVARAGVDVVLLETQYNSFTSSILEGINCRIHPAKDWGEAAEITRGIMDSFCAPTRKPAARKGKAASTA